MANEPSESESPMVDVEKCIALCGEKQNLMQTMLNDLRLQITKLEAESADMGSEKTGTKEKILVLAQQVRKLLFRIGIGSQDLLLHVNIITRPSFVKLGNGIRG